MILVNHSTQSSIHPTRIHGTAARYQDLSARSGQATCPCESYCLSVKRDLNKQHVVCVCMLAGGFEGHCRNTPRGPSWFVVL